MSERILLAIDAGGTRTRCAIATSGGRVVGAGSGGPANHILSGWEQARASIAAAIAAATTAAGARVLHSVVAGSAGVGANGEGREVVECLLAELLPGAERVRATGDMVAAFWGALRAPVGVVSNSGTGSVCFGRNAKGETRQVGGWGHLLGDEGSAYDIAMRGLNAVARATDGRGPATGLTAAFLRRVSARAPIELALHLYSQPFSREGIAALAVEVVQVARAGDAVAQSILRDAATELALAVITTARVLELERPCVSYAGSVFDAGDLVLEPFAAALAVRLPHASIAPPHLPPLGGGLRLALAACGEVEPDGLLEGWREQLRGVA